MRKGKTIMDFYFMCFFFTVVSMAFIGAFLPGWYFHVVFAKDKTAMEFHKERYEEIKRRLADKSDASD